MVESTEVNTTQVKRTGEIEEWTNRYLIHPISRALVTVFARWGVRPNTVSVIGMVLGAAAAVAYYQYAAWPMAVAGFVLMVGWHVMDGADGQLARLTGQTSEIGKVLDGLCDHGTFVLVYVSLTLAAAQTMGAWIWGVAVAAGVSHLVQASAYEFQRQAYDYWVHAKESARIVTPEDFRRELEEKGGAGRLFGQVYYAYLRIQHRIAGIDPALEASLHAALHAAVEEGTEAHVREAYRSVQLSAVKRWTLLCSNYRTIAIFIAALLGNPLYFFLFEIVGLNGVFAGLKAMQTGRNQTLRSWLTQADVAPPELVRRPSLA